MRKQNKQQLINICRCILIRTMKNWVIFLRFKIVIIHKRFTKEEIIDSNDEDEQEEQEDEQEQYDEDND